MNERDLDDLWDQLVLAEAARIQAEIEAAWAEHERRVQTGRALSGSPKPRIDRIAAMGRSEPSPYPGKAP